MRSIWRLSAPAVQLQQAARSRGRGKMAAWFSSPYLRWMLGQDSCGKDWVLRFSCGARGILLYW
jgi:hypothetical protein